ncbi:polysaccharide biosynthesis C-terminal domain-containing protein [Sutcliffiella horikoshii]|uniref:oligosaccharide flippase family protein n=1 Tax=Sutcliffiella horikoshii TaxID=79883 RepID=UPI00384DCD7D
MIYLRNLKEYKKKYNSIIVLFIIKILSMGLKYLLVLYLSIQLLTPSEFGMFSLFLIILNFAYLFVGFGVIDTGMYLISRDNSKELCGATLFLTLIISILFSFVLMAALFYYKFEYFIVIGILSCGFILNLFVKKISVGLHEKFSMYYFEFFMYLLSLILIILFANDVYDSIFFYSIGMLIVSLFFILRLKPTFSNLNTNLGYLMRNIKGYGTSVHLSQFIAMGTYDLDKLMLKHFFGFTSVGVYNLALTFIMPVKLFSMSLSEMLFKDFAKEKKIKKEVFILNLGISLVFSILLCIIGYYLIIFFYDQAYYEIIGYIYYLPILAVLSSIYVPINHFFSAKGLGKQKFINAVVLAISNIAFNFIFIPLFGVLGAIIATISALIVNNIMFIYQYKLYTRKK